jgi:hypothetical protein
MKALSIIAVILSVFGCIMSIAGIDNGCYTHDGTNHQEIFPTYLVMNLFFLGFSITSIVVSFKKKNVTS